MHRGTRLLSPESSEIGRQVSRAVGAASVLHRNRDELWPEFSGRDLVSGSPHLRFRDLASDGATSLDRRDRVAGLRRAAPSRSRHHPVPGRRACAPPRSSVRRGIGLGEQPMVALLTSLSTPAISRWSTLRLPCSLTTSRTVCSRHGPATLRSVEVCRRGRAARTIGLRFSHRSNLRQQVRVPA